MNTSTTTTMLTGLLSLCLFSTATAADFSGNLKGVTITDSQASNKPPTAAFTYTASGNTVTFDASHSFDSDGTIAEYKWDFGDGTSGNGEKTQHTYTTTKSILATLKLIDNQNAVALLQNKIQLQTFFSDSFSETTSIPLISHTPEHGGIWNVQSGSSYIVGAKGLVHTVDNSAPYLAYNEFTPTTADYSVAVTGSIRSLTWARSLVSCARLNSDFEGYCTRLIGNSSLQLNRYEKGAVKTLKSVGNLGLKENLIYKVSTIVNGSTVGYNVYQGDTLITSGSVIDSTYTTPGHPGLGLSSYYTGIISIVTE